VPSGVLARTIAGLRARSAGWRESACVWSGSREGCVKDVAFHHELGDDRATSLSLELPEAAKFALYKQLAARGESLLALLHTHPEEWVGLSWIDERNQLCSRIGFWSIVLPFYGMGEWHEAVVGFHMRCDRGWQQLHGDVLRERFQVEPVEP
jgi:hypothetical protein